MLDTNPLNRISGVLNHQECPAWPAGLDAMHNIRSVACGISLPDFLARFAAGYQQFALDHGQVLARAPPVGLAVQHTALCKAQFIDLVAARICRRGQDADRASRAAVFDAGHVGGAQHFDAVGRSIVEQAGEIDLQSAREIPQGRNGGRGFAAFDLADHGAADAGQLGHCIQRQALPPPRIFQPRRQQR